MSPVRYCTHIHPDVPFAHVGYKSLCAYHTHTHKKIKNTTGLAEVRGERTENLEHNITHVRGRAEL